MKMKDHLKDLMKKDLAVKMEILKIVEKQEIQKNVQTLMEYAVIVTVMMMNHLFVKLRKKNWKH